MTEYDYDVRKTAIETIGSFKNSIAIDSLSKIVNRDNNVEIIQLASQAIQIIQGIVED